jgi:hypothetical protein
MGKAGEKQKHRPKIKDKNNPSGLRKPLGSLARMKTQMHSPALSSKWRKRAPLARNEAVFTSSDQFVARGPSYEHICAG